MDSSHNGPLNPKPHDIAEAGPIDPATGQPDHLAEVSAVKSWFRENLVSLLITALVVGLVVVYTDPIDTLKVVLGLGLVIFIHELGHFLAAKWCDVHVKTFSIGFGPAVPFCSYKWGETTYMLGIIPLGGYVSMVGEGTGETGPEGDPDDDDNDPRSFKNKSVGRRMIIISAGVIMNVILGMGCFVAAYLHGVREEPAIAGAVISGSAAWQGGLQTDDHIVRIGNRENPTFKELRSVVMRTDKGERIPVIVERDGKRVELEIEPLREEGTYFPSLGIQAASQLTLYDARKPRDLRPVVPGTPAAAATPPFERGDRIIAMTDPEKPATVTPIVLDQDGQRSFGDYHRRMVLLASQPVTIVVQRKNSEKTESITVAPAYRSDLGLRMQMGEVVAVRQGSAAEKAGVKTHSADGTTTGDKILAVKLPPAADGRETWFTSGTPDWTKPEFEVGDPSKVDVKPLDPILLPLELSKWSDGKPADRTLRLVVLRQKEHNEDHPVELSLEYDPSYRFDREIVAQLNSPLPLSGLGLAYWVEPVINEVVPGSAAAAARLQSGDLVTHVQFKSLDTDGSVKTGDWDEVGKHQWASAEAAFQSRPPHELGLRVKRQGDQVVEVELKGRPDTNWPTAKRGLEMNSDYRVHQAHDIADALNRGGRRTVQFIKDVYINLYGMIRGRISARTMSGPLTIAKVSYKFAGEDFWQFLLFLGMISVNLAVVNFLPIPVLDGGHMVFLILEKILGRPVPERLFAIAMYVGLFLILSLMVFVLYLDVGRIFFGMF